MVQRLLSPAIPLSTICAFCAVSLSDYNTQETLEIGLAYGASAASQFLGVRRSWLRSGSSIRQSIHSNRPLGNARNYGNWIRPAIAKTSNYSKRCLRLRLPRLWSEGKRYDLICIDGSRLFEDVFIDFYHSTCRLAGEGGPSSFSTTAWICTSR